MEYKRLTQRGILLTGRTDRKALYYRLAILEDMIEDGWLIKLPCKVGDKFYEVFEYPPDYYEYECCGFSVVDGRLEVINEVDSRYYADEVFFSKEEAEARIAELKGQ